MTNGILTLIASPIDEDNMLDAKAFRVLHQACLDHTNNKILIEDPKPCRRRWVHFGLSRDAIEHFIEYNEHTQKEKIPSIIADLKKGVNYFLMSDGGLPAFCDPGQLLVRTCYENAIKVTSTPHSNSISLAISLSGIDCSQFFFAGFLPKENHERANRLVELKNMNVPIVLMDTPYRLKKLLEEIVMHIPERKLFLGLDLNSATEELYYAKAQKILGKVTEFKREFIIIID